MMNNLCKVSLALKGSAASCARRYVQSNASLLENCTELRNRNPRNLELMTIGRKPMGYHLNEEGHEYWHKLNVTEGSRTILLEVCHHKNGPVVTVSTTEWALKKQLFKLKDIAAYTNAGKILAQRCLESGIGSVYFNIDTQGSKKLTALADELKKGGIVLKEPNYYVHPDPWDSDRPVKPWTIIED